MAEEDTGEEAATKLSYAQSAIAEGVENEKCVVSQYRTSKKQKEIFEKHLDSCDSKRIPIEWVIDIADESNGWFYGTAYDFDDENGVLHVMVPDKDNPSFDGDVALDHRTVHLVECVDDHSHALFNKIIRDSVLKVRWEVEWFEEGEGDEDGPTAEGEETVNGRWVLTMARYYIRIANQLLVEEVGFGENSSKGFVMLTADINVKLRYCHKGRGGEDFTRLLKEGIVQSTPEAQESLEELDTEKPRRKSVTNKDAHRVGDISPSNNPVRKLAEMAGGLKDCLSDVLDDREKVCNDRMKMAKAFKAFAILGDLDSGMKLLSFVDDLDTGEQDALDAAADEAWFLCQKVDKLTNKLARAAGVGRAEEEGEAESPR